MPLPSSVSGKTAEDILSAWVPDSHIGDPDGAPDAWLQLSPILFSLIFSLLINTK